MSSTLRKITANLRDYSFQPRFWAVFSAIIVVFAIIGPFGTFERMTLATRMVYWAITMTGSWAISVTTIAVFNHMPIFARLNSHLRLALACFTASLPIALFLRFLLPYFSPNIEISILVHYLYALPLTLAFGFLATMVLSAHNKSHTSADDEANKKLNELLLHRLSPKNRGPVKYMTMEDHYVRVTTTRGEELVLMRMGDAVSAASCLPGVRIHRSHWVNSQFAQDTRKEAGRTLIVMDDGKQLPVSRTYQKDARAAGLC